MNMTNEEFHDALYRERCRREAVENDNRRLHVALRLIADMPMPEQDNMLSGNMRKVAVDVLAHHG